MNKVNDINSVVLFQIDRTSKVAKHYSQMIFDKMNFGITVDQWVLLKIIHEGGNMSQKELAERSMRDPASITRTLDLLVKKGYVLRSPDSSDRRKYEIDLSEDGERFVNKFMPYVMEQRTRSIKGFSKKELELLSSMLKRIQDNMT